MNLSFSIETKEGDEYRVAVIEAHIDWLSAPMRQMLAATHLQIGEILVERIRGEHCTSRMVLHEIANGLANMFADNRNLILYYFCDDMEPIPFRNIKGKNQYLSPQEYRSVLFCRMFDGYMKSHQVERIHNIPIVIEGDSYKQFLHLIARDAHLQLVHDLSNEIKEVWGKR